VFLASEDVENLEAFNFWKSLKAGFAKRPPLEKQNHPRK
jgi:hypothetical protein